MLLDGIRKTVRGPMAVAVVLIISIPFIMFGVESIFSINFGSSDPIKINGESITEAQIQQAVDNQVRSGDQTPVAQIRETVIDQMINREVLKQASADMGLDFSDKEVDRTIASNPQFMQDGKFSQQLFNQFISSAGISVATYRDYLRNDLKLQQMSSVFSAGEFVTPEELNGSAAYLKQVRNIQLLSRDIDSLAKQVKTTTEEEKAYFEDIQDQFVTPEQVSIDYIELDRDQFAANVKVEEQDIKQRYDDEVAQLKKQAQKRVAHIMLDIGGDQAKAVAALSAAKQRILGGEKFADVAKEVSQDPGTKANGGDLGFVSLTNFPPAFADAAVALKVGEISDPVVSDQGVHLITVLEEKAQPIPSYEERKGQLVAQVRNNKASVEFQKKVDQLADLAFNADDLQEPAKALKLEIKTTEPFSRTSKQTAISSDDAVLKASFSTEILDDKINSDVIQLSEGRALVFRLNKHLPSQQLSYDTVKQQVSTQLKNQKAKEQLAAWQKEAVAALESGKSPADVSKTLSGTVETLEGISAEDFSKIPFPLMQVAFSLPVPKDGKYSANTTDHAGKSYVVSVSDVKLGDSASMTNQDKQNIQNTLLRYSMSNGQQVFAEQLKKDANIRIRETQEDS